ncbi:MAG TPA: hypothetical protein VGX23_09810 [Actinocrinis sp.]|nr:hypothetical protein [Actinocrinis sp.]
MRTRVRGLAAIGAGLVLISGCSSSSSGHPLNLSAGATPLVTTEAPQDAADVTLQGLAVSPQQMGTGWTSQDVENGDEVNGEVTLDLCAQNFPSEDLRIGRHQFSLIPPGASADSDQAVLEELVAYNSGGAQQARNELLNAAAHCPPGLHQLPEPGVPAASFKITTLPANSSWLPGTVAVNVAATTSAGQKEDDIAIYQFQGDFMAGVYAETTDGKPDSDELKAAAAAATLLKTATATTGTSAGPTAGSTAG